jgi:hypothetical protein
MVQYFDEISPGLSKWIEQQQVFWVGTAPLTGDGHVNVSPKGGEGTVATKSSAILALTQSLGMFHVVNPRQVWYEDLTGSG